MTFCLKLGERNHQRKIDHEEAVERYFYIYVYIYIHISTKTLKDSLMANGAVGGAGLLILETEAS